jgi:flagellar protein FlaG
MNISDISRATSVQPYVQPVVQPKRASESATQQPVAQPLTRTGGDAAQLNNPAAQVNKPNGLYGNQPVNTQDAQAAQTAQVSPEELNSALEKVEKFVSATTSDINFSIDEESGSTVVKIVDRSTQEVIRQIPSEEMLEISRALDRLQGLFLKNKA